MSQPARLRVRARSEDGNNQKRFLFPSFIITGCVTTQMSWHQMQKRTTVQKGFVLCGPASELDPVEGNTRQHLSSFPRETCRDIRFFSLRPPVDGQTRSSDNLAQNKQERISYPGQRNSASRFFFSKSSLFVLEDQKNFPDLDNSGMLRYVGQKAQHFFQHVATLQKVLDDPGRPSRTRRCRNALLLPRCHFQKKNTRVHLFTLHLHP